jgi:hypothetical protein
MSKLWIVANGKNNTTALALFSSASRAEGYRKLLVERYSAGRKLKALRKSLAENAGWWDLGIDGPQVVEAEVDADVEALPGAWAVRVDEASRMVSCRFSTEKRPDRKAELSRGSERITCEAYGATPHDALSAAIKAMQQYRENPGRGGRPSRH